MTINYKVEIDVGLARDLIATQFPQWKHLSIKPVQFSGWDNKTFHLGKEMAIRLPSDEEYAPQILKEFTWLPKLAQGTTLKITQPVALGMPTLSYPWHWSINQWIKGESASTETIQNMNQFAKDLGGFIKDLHKIDSSEGPLAGPHNFYRGGGLLVYDDEMRQGISSMQCDVLKNVAKQLWNDALSTSWQNKAVWIHGDIATGNLLVEDGKLCGVIDFGQLAVGDPACDLAIAWNLFRSRSRNTFLEVINLDRNTWVRALAWTLWKTICWPVIGTDVRRIIYEVLEDYQSIYK